MASNCNGLVSLSQRLQWKMPAEWLGRLCSGCQTRVAPLRVAQLTVGQQRAESPDSLFSTRASQRNSVARITRKTPGNHARPLQRRPTTPGSGNGTSSKTLKRASCAHMRSPGFSLISMSTSSVRASLRRWKWPWPLTHSIFFNVNVSWARNRITSCVASHQDAPRVPHQGESRTASLAASHPASLRTSLLCAVPMQENEQLRKLKTPCAFSPSPHGPFRTNCAMGAASDPMGHHCSFASCVHHVRRLLTPCGPS